MTPKMVRIKVINFDKYNPRKDVKSSSWFRLNNNFLVDSKIFSLQNDAKVTLISILGETSCKNCDEILADLKYFSKICHISAKRVFGFFKVFESLGMIEIQAIDGLLITPKKGVDDVTCASRARTATTLGHVPYERTNERNERDETLYTVDDIEPDVIEPLDWESEPPEREVIKKPRSRKKPKPEPSPSDLELAERWQKFALFEMPWRDGDSSWTVTAFAEAICEVRTTMNITSDGLSSVLDFIKRDDFWRQNAISPRGLLKKSKDGHRKIETILVRMRSKTDRLAQSMAEWAADDTPPSEFPF